MKKILLTSISSLLTIIILSTLSTSNAGFLIKLKNGGTIYTEMYEEEGNKIILYLESGTVRIGKDEVRSISKSEKQIRDDTETKDAKILPKKQDEKRDEKVKKPDEKINEKDSVIVKKEVEYYKKRKKEIQIRLEEAKKVYFDATNKEEKDKARKVMLSISDELSNLQEEVKKKNNGILPKWWQEE